MLRASACIEADGPTACGDGRYMSHVAFGCWSCACATDYLEIAAATDGDAHDNRSVVRVHRYTIQASMQARDAR